MSCWRHQRKLTVQSNTQILAQAEGGDPQQILDARVLKHDLVTRAVLLSREDASVLASSKPALQFSESEGRDLIDALRASQAQNDPTSAGDRVRGPQLPLSLSSAGLRHLAVCALYPRRRGCQGLRGGVEDGRSELRRVRVQERPVNDAQCLEHAHARQHSTDQSSRR